MDKLNCYEVGLDEWKKEFVKDGLKFIDAHQRYEIIEDRFIPVMFFNRTYRVDLLTGNLLEEDGEKCQLQAMTQMMIFSHLKYIHRDAAASGITKGISEIDGLKYFSSKSMFSVFPAKEALEKAFDENPDVIDIILERFNGVREEMGDISFSICAFKDVKYTYIYWKGDDEFASTLKTLYEVNILDFLHMEAALLVGGIGTELICQAIGAEYKKWSWEI
ncbi:DUF3786 domain-containing protein [Acetobacterium tundrae]|uniref:DUF3786 domain-containing protein n=1 Tax=Acetobacterium tundrae TaxID=132932 RepID=A0ABR6WQ70_9FIRM|nr:DUF3786 domain-containing protein [Acetobacterium tundrae]MBC3798614.1 DUF3786 domain-containing protein [Acetobacterium tundrae]